eukprot:1160922-Prorocentrum_minimum.AAC.2
MPFIRAFRFGHAVVLVLASVLISTYFSVLNNFSLSVAQVSLQQHVPVLGSAYDSADEFDSAADESDEGSGGIAQNAEERVFSGKSGRLVESKPKRLASSRVITDVEFKAPRNYKERGSADTVKSSDKSVELDSPSSRQSSVKILNTTGVAGDVVRATSQDRVCGGAPLRYMPFIKLTSSRGASGGPRETRRRRILLASAQGPVLRGPVVPGKEHNTIDGDGTWMNFVKTDCEDIPLRTIKVPSENTTPDPKIAKRVSQDLCCWFTWRLWFLAIASNVSPHDSHHVLNVHNTARKQEEEPLVACLSDIK